MAPLSHKRCTKCGEVKALDEFHRDGRAGDGYRADCKVCSRERAARYRESHPNDREYLKQWRADNREHVRQRRREKYAADPEAAHERNQAYREANAESLREKEGRRREDLRTQVFAHYGQTCACCGSTDRLTIDHVSGGGSQHRLEVLGRAKVAGWVFYRWLINNGFPEGYQTLCFPCNQSKFNTERCRLAHG